MKQHKDAARARRLLHLFARCVEFFDKPEKRKTVANTIEDEYGLRVGDIPGFRFGEYDPDLHLSPRGRALVQAWMYSRWPNLKKEFGLEYVGVSP